MYLGKGRNVKIVSIGSGAFAGCSKLTSVKLAEGITKIGSTEFDGCYSLKEVTIPSTVTSIGDRAFIGCCSLKAIYFKGSVLAEVGSGVFEGVSPDFTIFFNSTAIEITTPS